MSFVIPQNTTDADEKTLDFFVVDADLAPVTTGVTGENARLRFGNGAQETSDNTIVALDAAIGWYKLTLSDTEAANAPCLGSMVLTSVEVADILPVRVEFEIGAADSLDAGDSKQDIADLVNEGAWEVFKSVKRTGTNGNGGLSAELPTTGAVTTTLATDADAEPITEVDTAS